MPNETVRERQIYRVLVDKANRVWDKIMLLTSANSVDFEDGMTAEQKVGSILGLAAEKKQTPGYVMDASVAEIAPLELTATLTAGQTTKSWTNAKINDTAIIQVFTNVDGVVPSSKVQSGTTFTVEFPVQEVDVNIIVHVHSR